MILALIFGSVVVGVGWFLIDLAFGEVKKC